MTNRGRYFEQSSWVPLEANLAAEALMLSRGEPIAVRGSRLVLSFGSTSSDAAGDELTLTEVDPGGRLTAQLSFDQGQLHDALDVLSRRWLELDAPPGAETTVEVDRRFRHSFRDGDVAAWHELYTDDCRIVDRRRLGLGERTVEEWVESNRDSAGAMDEWMPEDVAIAQQVALMRMEKVRWDGPGSWSLLVITCFEETRVKHMELFDLDSRAAARDRFGELAGR